MTDKRGISRRQEGGAAIKMIRLMYDYQIMLMQHYGGISRYFYEVVTRMPKEEVDMRIPVIHNLNYYFADYFHKPVRLINNKKWYRRIVRFNRWYDKKLTEKGGKDIIFHPTYYNPYFLEGFQGKLVVTVHDMIHENYLEYFEGNATIAHKKLLMERADKIIAVSHTTKKDIIKIYPQIDQNKIVVIHHGCDSRKQEIQSAELEQKYACFPRFILFVGIRVKYKNFMKFAPAAANILSKNHDMGLVCVGGGELLPEEEAVFREKNCRDKVMQVAASDEELTWLYQHASCFVFPSMAEGFGIPILEAWKNECPVVAADTECFREVGGDAVLFFDPDNAEMIEEKICEAFTEDTRRKLLDLGRERSAEFSWDKCANQHLEVYRQLGAT